MLVTMRGEFAEFNPWQVPMGSITEASLKLAGFLTYRAEAAEEVAEFVGAGCDMAFAGDLAGRGPAVATPDRPQVWRGRMK